MQKFLETDTLRTFAQEQGPVIYLILFAAFLFQTGFLLGPAIPGNPLIFAAGLLANPATGPLNLFVLILVVSAGVFTGNLLNYAQGKKTGPAVKKRERWRQNIENAEVFLRSTVLARLRWRRLFRSSGHSFLSLREWGGWITDGS